MIVGLTGGIGSGKSTVATMFKDLGVPIYVADDEAKKLMQHSEAIRKDIIGLLGNAAYHNSVPNREFIAAKVFKNPKLLQQLNNIIHPAVRAHFLQWYKAQKAPYVIQEAAILFESGGYKNCDVIILVTAPVDERISRVLQRDKTTEEEVLNRINNQWPDDKKIPLADFVINNITLKNTKEQVETIHKKILIKSANRSKF